MKNHFLLLTLFVFILFSYTKSDSVSYTEKLLDSPVNNIVWCGSSRVVNEDDEIIEMEISSTYKKKMFLLTEKGMVYRTPDNGKTWENITETF